MLKKINWKAYLISVSILSTLLIGSAEKRFSLGNFIAMFIGSNVMVAPIVLVSAKGNKD